jgi:hypothetical protein
MLDDKKARTALTTTEEDIPTPKASTTNLGLIDNDTSSTVGPSTIVPSSYAPSMLSEHRGLISNRGILSSRDVFGRARSVPDAGQKTASRKAFVVACKTVDVFVPLDVNEDITTMRGSSIAKLGRSVRRISTGGGRAEPGVVREERRGSVRASTGQVLGNPFLNK